MLTTTVMRNMTVPIRGYFGQNQGAPATHKAPANIIK